MSVFIENSTTATIYCTSAIDIKFQILCFIWTDIFFMVLLAIFNCIAISLLPCTIQSFNTTNVCRM